LSDIGIKTTAKCKIQSYLTKGFNSSSMHFYKFLFDITTTVRNKNELLHRKTQLTSLKDCKASSCYKTVLPDANKHLRLQVRDRDLGFSYPSLIRQFYFKIQSKSKSNKLTVSKSKITSIAFC